MTEMNFNKLQNSNPTVYDTIVNQAGQKVTFVEHPILGDEYPIIAMIAEFQTAANTEFFDMADMHKNSDYMPIYMHGKIDAAWVFDF